MTNQASSDEPFDISKAVPPKTIPQATTIKPRAKFVFNLFDNIKIDFSTSCTKEDAVAKMLGWLRGSVRIDPDEINIHDVSITQMPFLAELYFSLEDYLLMLREDALDQVATAFKEPCAIGSIQTEALDTLNHCDELIMKAAAYMNGIDDELTKGTESALRIDPVKTESTGELYITLKSLDEWAQQNYKISIIDNVVPTHWDVSAISKQVAKQAQEYSSKDGLTKTKKENLYITFGLLIEAYAEMPNSGYLQSGKPVVDAIAKQLNHLAGQASKEESPSGQSVESIKDRIEEALKIKESKLIKG